MGYFLGNLLNMGALPGCCGFVLGFLPAALYDRKAAKKKTVHTITGYAHTKGEHHID